LWNPHFDSGPAHEELTLYCAAGLSLPPAKWPSNTSNKYGVKIVLDAGPSNALLTRLKVLKQPHDLFLAADDSYIRTARDKFGLVAESIPVARLHPVIAVKADNPKKIAGVADLLRDDVKVALATEDAAVGKPRKTHCKKPGSGKRSINSRGNSPPRCRSSRPSQPWRSRCSRGKSTPAFCGTPRPSSVG